MPIEKTHEPNRTNFDGRTIPWRAVELDLSSIFSCRFPMNLREIEVKYSKTFFFCIGKLVRKIFGRFDTLLIRPFFDKNVADSSCVEFHRIYPSRILIEITMENLSMRRSHFDHHGFPKRVRSDRSELLF